MVYCAPCFSCEMLLLIVRLTMVCLFFSSGRALLNEIEVFPDMFGGPRGDLRGKGWAAVKRKLVGSMVEQMDKILAL